MIGYKKTEYPGSIHEYHLVLTSNEMVDVLKVLHSCAYSEAVKAILLDQEEEFRKRCGCVIDSLQLYRIADVVERDINRYKVLFSDLSKLI